MKFLRHPQVHRALVIVFAVSTFFLMTGCAGSVLGDAENVLSVIVLGVNTLAGVAVLIPGLSVLSVPLSEVGASLAALQQAFSQWQANATQTTYQNILSFVSTLQANLQKIVAPEGVSAAVAAKINSIVNALIAQVGAWVALIKQLEAQTPAAGGAATANEVALATAPVTVTRVQPMHSKDLHKQLKTIVEEQTGESKADWAFAAASRFN